MFLNFFYCYNLLDGKKRKVNEVSKQTCQRILSFIFQNYISIPLFTCKIYLREEKGIESNILWFPINVTVSFE